MKIDAETISVNGVEYIPKSQIVNKMEPTLEGKKYVIVRTQSAGVFAGYLDSRTGQEVVLLKARRLWYWDGAASLSQLAIDGVSKPKSCKFPEEVSKVELLQAIEILDVTDGAKKSIAGVPIWKK